MNGIMLGFCLVAQVQGSEWLGDQDDGGFGRSVALLGDVDGDTVPDVLVGQPTYDGPNGTDAGRALVYSGATSSLIRSHDGEAAGDQFGLACAALGDLDLDGVADYAVGAPMKDEGSGAGVGDGRLYVFDGSQGTTLYSKGSSPLTLGTRYGWSIAGMGDLDGDGRPDVAVGAPQAWLSLPFVEFLGAGGAVIHKIDGTTSSTGTSFGNSIALTSDVDGDGVDDIVIGDTGFSHGTFGFSGRTVVHSGKTGTRIWFINGISGDKCGFAVASIADVGGDSRPDVVVSTEWRAKLYVLDGSNGAILTTITTHYYGAVASTGDVDRDGTSDFAATVLTGPSGTPVKVSLFSGATLSLLIDVVSTSSSGTAAQFGDALSGGDANLDGFGDLLIGDSKFQDNSSGRDTGGAFLVLGCPAWWENYGAGWPGTNGIPGLVALDDPGVGETIGVQIDNSAGATTIGLLLVGFSQTSVPTSADGTLLVVPTFLTPLSLPPTGLQLQESIPDDPTLYFLDLYVQVIELDPLASKRLSFTPGLRLRLGFDF